MTRPDDRELEQYLEGGSKLSRRYREASGETSPPDLDETIRARARAELKRQPSLNRLLAPVALAASVVLGVNLAWNVYQAAPAPGEAPAVGEESRDDAFVPEAPPPAEPQARNAAPAAPSPRPAPEPEIAEALASESGVVDARRERKAKAAGPQREPEAGEPPATPGKVDAEVEAQERRKAFARQVEAQRRALKMKDEAGVAAPVIDSAPMAASFADHAGPLSEAHKIDRLIAYVRALPGAVFIRHGKEHTPEEAAGHLQLKREKAGSRIRTADDFIRLCASHSSMSGDAYLIRLEDGRTRTAEDVLREELARINNPGRR